MTRRSGMLIVAAGCLACGRPSPVVSYPLNGEIVQLHPASRLAIIRHETIKGPTGKVWMEAMTMEFPVRNSEEFARLKVGQRIQATVYQREPDFEYWIEQIRITADPEEPACRKLKSC